MSAIRSPHIEMHRLARLSSTAAMVCAFFALSATAAHAQCISITSYGGSGNGTTNNSPALASAVAALPAQGGCIALPGGRYLFSTAVTINYPATGTYSLTLAGAGTDSTTLYWAAANGITINANGAAQTTHVHNMTFSTGSAGSYSGLTLHNSSALGVIALSDISNTIFRGDDGGHVTDYWGYGIDVESQSNVNFDSDTFFGPNVGNSGAGSGIYLNGGNINGTGIVYNIAKCGFFWLGSGLEIGTYIQGVTVTQSNFTNGTTGIWLIPSSNTNFDELAVTGGNQFGLWGNDILIQQPMAHLIVNGNLFFVNPGNTGIYLDSYGSNAPQNNIANNVFYTAGGGGVSAYGILANGSYPNTVVTGNSFQGMTTAVELIGTSGWNVQANSYLNVTTHVNHIGSNSVGVATD